MATKKIASLSLYSRENMQVPRTATVRKMRLFICHRMGSSHLKCFLSNPTISNCQLQIVWGFKSGLWKSDTYKHKGSIQKHVNNYYNYLGRLCLKTVGTGESYRLCAEEESCKGEWEEVEEKGWKPEDYNGN